MKRRVWPHPTEPQGQPAGILATTGTSTVERATTELGKKAATAEQSNVQEECAMHQGENQRNSSRDCQYFNDYGVASLTCNRPKGSDSADGKA
jgi:hypothetical protein